MDNSDNLSICSELVSNHSECLGSNNSSLSGLSNYYNEYLCFKNSTKLDQYYENDGVITSKGNEIDVQLYEERINKLNKQLQNTLKDNEKYKNDLYNLGKKVELSFHDRIDKLLKRNKQLDNNLENANKQIQRLIKNQQENNKSISEQKLIELESKNLELNLKINFLTDELLHIKNEKNQTDFGNKNLINELNELRIELSIKNNCIHELKSKISEQYCEIENNLKNHSKLLNNSNCLEVELGQLKKSENWFKEQLKQSQNDKKNLLDEIIKLKEIQTNSNKEIDNLKLELKKLRLKCEQSELKSLNNIKNDFVFEEIMTSSIPENINSVCNGNELESITNYYESTIFDLTEEILRIKRNITEKQESYELIIKENSDLLSKSIVLQKELQTNQILVDELKETQQYLMKKINILEENRNEQNQVIKSLKTVEIKLKIELNNKNKEKETIEDSVKIIRQKFNMFKKNYNTIKNEVLEKNELIIKLENDKQKLFMENNWNLCELENFKNKSLIIDKLNKKIVKLNNLLINNNNELDLLKTKKDELEENCREVRIELHKLKNNLLDKDDKIKNLNDKIIETEENYEKQLLSVERSYKHMIDDIKLTNNNKNTLISENISSFFVNNYLNLLKIDNVNILQEIIMKLCKLNGNGTRNSEYFKLLLQNYQLDEKVIHKSSKTNLKQIKNQIKLVEERCESLNNKNNENLKLLRKFKECNNNICDVNPSLNQQNQHLQDLLEVRKLEKMELQERYEINNRTLLRKVKEHMKGRNLAEKHRSDLQELYNTLFDEFNMLKLKESSLNHEITNLNISNEYYVNINKKLKDDLLKSENELNDYKNKQIEIFRIENNLKIYDGNLKLKDNMIDELKQQIQKLKLENCNLASINNKLKNDMLEEKNSLVSKLDNVEINLSCKESIIKQLNQEMFNEKGSCNLNHMNINEADKKLQEINDRNQFLSNELDFINSLLQEKSDELNELKDGRLKFENNYLKKEEEMEHLIIKFKKQLQVSCNDFNLIKSEKLFLQRLCNDLKIALKTQSDHNKLLKHQINLNREKGEFNSLPNILPSLPVNKFDDAYINELLKQNQTTVYDKPLKDLQASLGCLKKEILRLQEEIVEKNLSSKI